MDVFVHRRIYWNIYIRIWDTHLAKLYNHNTTYIDKPIQIKKAICTYLYSHSHITYIVMIAIDTKQNITQQTCRHPDAERNSRTMWTIDKLFICIMLFSKYIYTYILCTYVKRTHTHTHQVKISSDYIEHTHNHIVLLQQTESIQQNNTNKKEMKTNILYSNWEQRFGLSEFLFYFNTSNVYQSTLNVHVHLLFTHNSRRISSRAIGAPHSMITFCSSRHGDEVQTARFLGQ